MDLRRDYFANNAKQNKKLYSKITMKVTASLSTDGCRFFFASQNGNWRLLL